MANLLPYGKSNNPRKWGVKLKKKEEEQTVIAFSNVPCNAALDALKVCRTADPDLPVSSQSTHQQCCTQRDSLTTKYKSSEHKWDYPESLDYQTNYSHLWRKHRHPCALSQSQSQSLGFLHSLYTQQFPSNFFSQNHNLHHSKHTNTNAKSGRSWTMLLSLEIVLCLCLLSSIGICTAATDLDTSFNNIVQSFRNLSILSPTKDYLDPCKAGMYNTTFTVCINHLDPKHK